MITFHRSAHIYRRTADLSTGLYVSESYPRVYLVIVFLVELSASFQSLEKVQQLCRDKFGRNATVEDEKPQPDLLRLAESNVPV